jgi:hypothetical protein
MQDLIAIALSAAAAFWLAWTLKKRFFAPPCQPPAPGGSDGFVPLDALRKPKR